MGWKKWFKKITKKVTRPVSKVFKGVAKGIARVGKAVMKGVGKIGKKLGPLGMIGLAIALPAALGGLSGMIGTAGVPQLGYQATGWMGSQNVFLRSIGTVGNAIRTGYSNATGAIGRTFGNITKSISEGFSRFTKGTGNIWKDISQGAKNLFNNAKTTVNNFRKAKGSVKVKGWGDPFGYTDYTTMTAEQAGALIQPSSGGQALLKGADLSGQTLGSSYDKLISDTINSSFDKSGWDSGTIRRFNDAKKFTQSNNTYVNDYDLFNGLSNQGQTYHAPTKSWTTDLGRTGDYKLANPNEPTSYTFTGDKSFDNPVAKKFNYKEKLKKGYKYAKAAKDTLLSKSDIIEPEAFDWFATEGATAADSTGAVLSATDIKGATGSSSYANVFGDAAWHKLKAYHKNMNYLGST